MDVACSAVSHWVPIKPDKSISPHHLSLVAWSDAPLERPKPRSVPPPRLFYLSSDIEAAGNQPLLITLNSPAWQLLHRQPSKLPPSKVYYHSRWCDCGLLLSCLLWFLWGSCYTELCCIPAAVICQQEESSAWLITAKNTSQQINHPRVHAVSCVDLRPVRSKRMHI